MNPPPDVVAFAEQRERGAYAARYGLFRKGYESVRRNDAAMPSYRAQQFHEAEALQAQANADYFLQLGQAYEADGWRRVQHEHSDLAAYYKTQVDDIIDGRIVPPLVHVDADRWDDLNTDDGHLAAGPVETGTVSALTGADVPPPSDQTRPYGQPGGLRPPLALHQRDLERAMPRDPAGGIVRTPDPRDGDWFGLTNDGGPTADATRSINCQDCVISFFETWAHGRPRVSAPRTFDCYANGNIDKPEYGESGGPQRAEDITGGRYQTVMPDATTWAPEHRRQAAHQAYSNLHHQLTAGGHGSMAFIISGATDGTAHAWAAINQNGTILFIDPQSGTCSDNGPLYWDVTRFDAMVLGPAGEPMPLANHPPGHWTGYPYDTAPPAPEPGPTVQAQQPEPYLNKVHLLGEPSLAPTPGSPGPHDSASQHRPAPADDPRDAKGGAEPDSPTLSSAPDAAAPVAPANGSDSPRPEASRTPRDSEPIQLSRTHATDGDTRTGPDRRPDTDGPAAGSPAQHSAESPGTKLAGPSTGPASPAPGGVVRQPSAGSPAEMFRDPTPAELQSLKVGEPGFAELGLDPDALPADERRRFELALTRTAMISPDRITFTQRSVSPQTSDQISAEDLIEHMRDGGWRGGPVHGVRWGDGSFVSLDNRRLRAARRAGLREVPFVVHGPNDRLADWPQEWPQEKRQRNALTVDIMELADGSWVVGGDEGRVVYAKGTVAETFGEISMFRAAEQRSLLPGHLFGAQREPVLLAKPSEPNLDIRLDDHEREVLNGLRTGAEAAADRVQADLASIAQAINAAFGPTHAVELRGVENRVKSFDSLARKYDVEARIKKKPVETFAGEVNDVLRFSLSLPPGDRYASALRDAVARLEQLGYQIDPKSKNFWKSGNRFYGYNCTVTSAKRQVFELQFPTEASWRAGKQTHDQYEVLRREDELAPRRIHAFLQMLAVNKRLAIDSDMPSGLTSMAKDKDASFAKWVSDRPRIWESYKAWLAQNDRSFADVVSEFGLDARDFPITEEVARELGEDDVRVLHGVSGRDAGVPGGDHTRGRGSERLPNMGSPGGGMDVRPVIGAPVSGEPRELGRVQEGRPGDGGADDAGDHGRREPAGRGVDPVDLPVEGGSAAERRLEAGEGSSTFVVPPDSVLGEFEPATESSPGLATPPGSPSSRGAPANPALARARAAIVEHVSPYSPALADTVDRLMGIHDAHPSDLTRALLDPARLGRTVRLIKEVADGRTLAPYGHDLDRFMAQWSGDGPLFQPIAATVNMNADGRSRKATFVKLCKELDLARQVGDAPSADEITAIDDYDDRLRTAVLPSVTTEIGFLAQRLESEFGIGVTTSARAKRGVDLVDKVARMRTGRTGAPGRPEYEVGDVIDAVGARITAPDMRSLEVVFAQVKEHFGVGDGGRILEIENMYAEPKGKAPAYRVVPMVIAIMVNGQPYTFELQLCTERASIAADIEHNTIFKPYVPLDTAARHAVVLAMREAAALDLLETRHPSKGNETSQGGAGDDLMSRGAPRSNRDVADNGGGLARGPDTVAEVVWRADIDLQGAQVVLIEDADELRYLDALGACAWTPGDLLGQQVRLGPAAFADTETLVAILQHEATHVAQLRRGVSVDTGTLRQLEDEAYASEAGALQRWRERST